MYNTTAVTNVRKEWCLVRDIRTILYLHTYSHTPAHAIDSFSNNFLHYLKSNWVKRIFTSNIWINPTSWFDDSWSFSWRKIQHQAEEPTGYYMSVSKQSATKTSQKVSHFYRRFVICYFSNKPLKTRDFPHYSFFSPALYQKNLQLATRREPP